MPEYRGFPSYKDWMHHNCGQDAHEQGVDTPEPTRRNGLQAREAKVIHEERAQKSQERRKRAGFHQQRKK